jgi:anthranilate synthase component 2
MKVLLVDNYDSFVYNLAQYVGSLGAEPVVLRNDATIDSLRSVNADALIVSPGPGKPEDAGCSIAAIREFGPRIPVLGVCLGHQAIGVAYGGKVVRAERVMHGKTSKITHSGTGIFAGVPDDFEATRYHSLVIEPASMPSDLEITAQTRDGVIMGVRHRSDGVEGVQFHPESILTAPGMKMIENFLRSADPQ